MDPFINTAIKAARLAGQLILKASDRLDMITIKTKTANEFVTQIDEQSEKLITDLIHKTYPNHGIMGEEGSYFDTHDEIIWIIDPLDGTTNFIHGFPHYAVSIAIKIKNRMEYGVIYDPVRDDLFIAERGHGARLNDHRIRVSNRKSLESALLGTGFPYRHPANLDFYLNCFKDLFKQITCMRRAGSAALDLAYVAAGKLDGFWEIGLKEWDFAAGVLLIKEAGGLISDFQGAETYHESGNIVAGTPKVFKEILQTINPYLKQFS